MGESVERSFHGNLYFKDLLLLWLSLGCAPRFVLLPGPSPSPLRCKYFLRTTREMPIYVTFLGHLVLRLFFLSEYFQARGGYVWQDTVSVYVPIAVLPSPPDSPILPLSLFRHSLRPPLLIHSGPSPDWLWPGSQSALIGRREKRVETIDKIALDLMWAWSRQIKASVWSDRPLTEQLSDGLELLKLPVNAIPWQDIRKGDVQMTCGGEEGNEEHSVKEGWHFMFWLLGSVLSISPVMIMWNGQIVTPLSVFIWWYGNMNIFALGIYAHSWTWS